MTIKIPDAGKFYVRRVHGDGHVYHGQKMFEHGTYNQACNEAHRLAMLNPGSEFAVLARCLSVKVEVINVTNLLPPQEDNFVLGDL